MSLTPPSSHSGGFTPTPGSLATAAALFYTAQGGTGTPAAGGTSWPTTFKSVIPIDPVDFVYGVLQDAATAPLATYGAAGLVFSYGGVVFTATDTSGDQYDCGVSVLIQSDTGLQSLRLDGSGSIAASPTGGTVTIAQADLTPTAITGSDLAYDTGSGHVTSTAGGNFAVILTVTGNFD